MTRTISQTIILQPPNAVTKYITYISAEGGIKVHNLNDLSNYIQMNSDSISIWRDLKKRMELDDSTLKFYKNDDSTHPLVSYGSSINFYKPGTDVVCASIATDGIILEKGGIKAGTAGQSEFIYLSTDDYGSQLTIGNGTNKTDWKAIIGTNFGVDDEGNLYVTNASITGNIVATSFEAKVNGNTRTTVDSNGLTVYDGSGIGSSNIQARFGSTVQVGKTGVGYIVISSTGLGIYAGSGNTELAYFGYDSGINHQGSTSIDPYYTLGLRKAGEAIGNFSVVAGYNNTASNYMSFAEGLNTIASGDASHAEGVQTTASGDISHAEGYGTTSSESGAHAEGGNNTSQGTYSHAEGYTTTAGSSTTTTLADHAEGSETTANGGMSHAEGYKTTASKTAAHAEGFQTTASETGAHSEGYETEASGLGSHASGMGTKASYTAQTAIGQYNSNNSSNIFEIGYGGSSSRSNCFYVTTSGNVYARTFTPSSDARLKTEYESLEKYRKLFMDLKPIKFDWAKITSDGKTNYNYDDKHHFGLVAQEVKELFEKEGFENFGLVSKEGGEYYGISYTELIPLCIDMIQKQEKEIKALKSDIELIKEKLCI